MTYVNDFCTDVHSLDFHHFATADSAITNSLVHGGLHIGAFNDVGF